MVLASAVAVVEAEALDRVCSEEMEPDESEEMAGRHEWAPQASP